MPKPKKKRTDKGVAEQSPGSTVIARDRKGRRTGFLIASVVIILILVIIGVNYYPTYVAPYRLTVISVDDTSIRMDYFLKRLKLTGVDPKNMLTNLAQEQIAEIAAPRYGIEISREDVDQKLRIIAQGESETISESEFKEWYRQQLNETRLSDAEYRKITTIGLIFAQLHDYLAARVPTVAPQVHLYAISVETYEDAEEIRARWEAGEDFTDLAREVSLDLQTQEQEGEIGWFPRGVLDTQFEYTAFNLSTGNVSEPLSIVSETTLETGETVPSVEGYYLLMVSERADAREIDEEYMPVLRDRVLEDWFVEEWNFHEIKYHGFNNGFDSYTYYWVMQQLAKG